MEAHQFIWLRAKYKDQGHTEFHNLKTITDKKWFVFSDIKNHKPLTAMNLNQTMHLGLANIG
jgi:hypothetical protein